MAISFGWIVIAALFGLAAMQGLYAWLHCQFVLSDPKESAGEFAPVVAVILCLRGRDPSLSACLTGLVNQNYDSYSIQIVVDDKRDLALADATFFFDSNEFKHFETHVLSEHPVQCSLKCSAIVKAISNLNDSVEVVALIDADAVADPNWIADLIAPLADPGVGASTGNRWFSPTRNNLGSLVRKTWNAAAVAQMTFYQIPWGGTLALKTSTIRDCGLLDRWALAFCEDTMLPLALRSQDLKIARIPNLILSNDESITLRGAFDWIVRQMLTVRLYHRDWPLVLTHGVFSGGVLIASLIAIVWLLLDGQTRMAIGLTNGLIFFQLINAGLLTGIELANVQAIATRGMESKSKNSFAKGILAILLTQLMHPVAVVTAALAKRVSWRGIDYEIIPGKRIQMVEYRPYDESTASDSSSIG